MWGAGISERNAQWDDLIGMSRMLLLAHSKDARQQQIITSTALKRILRPYVLTSILLPSLCNLHLEAVVTFFLAIVFATRALLVLC
jgi:hypothetical protein